jgi:hypothetical protein
MNRKIYARVGFLIVCAWQSSPASSGPSLGGDIVVHDATHGEVAAMRHKLESLNKFSRKNLEKIALASLVIKYTSSAQSSPVTFWYSVAERKIFFFVEKSPIFSFDVKYLTSKQAQAMCSSMNCHVKGGGPRCVKTLKEQVGLPTHSPLTNDSLRKRMQEFISES